MKSEITTIVVYKQDIQMSYNSEHVQQRSNSLNNLFNLHILNLYI